MIGKIQRKENYKVKTHNGMQDKYKLTINGINYAGWGTGSGLEEGMEIEFDFHESHGFNDIDEESIVKVPAKPMTEALSNVSIKDLVAKINELSDRITELNNRITNLERESLTVSRLQTMLKENC